MCLAMEHWFYTPWLLLVPILALRLAGVRSHRAPPWSSRIDIGLAGGLGVGTALVNAWVLAPRHIATVLSSDFSQVGTVAGSLVIGRPAPSLVLREPGAAILPTLLSVPLGVMDGLALAALISSVVTGAALYFWGRALLGRPAGVAAAVLACAFVPLVVLPRYYAFYPEVTACYACCAAAAACAWRWRGLSALACGGAGVGLALLSAPLGLLVGGVTLVGLLVLALIAPVRRIPARLGVLLLPVVLSYGVARVVTPPDAKSLEAGVVVFISDSRGLLLELRGWMLPPDLQPVGYGLLRRLASDPFSPHRGADRCYRWGRSGVHHIPGTLASLALLSAAMHLPEDDGGWGAPQPHQGAAVAAQRVAGERARRHVHPWLFLSLASLLVVGVGLRRRPAELVILLLLLLPFALSTNTMRTTQVWARYMMSAMLPVPVLLGSAWAMLAFGPARDEHAAGPRWRSSASLLTLVVLASLVLGLIPSWLAPDAPWRGERFPTCGDQRGQFQGAARRLAETTDRAGLLRAAQEPFTGRDPHKLCHLVLAVDLQRGIPFAGRIFSVGEAEPAPGRPPRDHP